MKKAGLGNSQLILKCQTHGENNPLIEGSRVCVVHMFHKKNYFSKDIIFHLFDKILFY